MKRKIALLAAVLCLTMALSPAVLAAEPTQAELCYPTAVTQSEDGAELRKMYDLGPEEDGAEEPLALQGLDQRINGHKAATFLRTASRGVLSREAPTADTFTLTRQEDAQRHR